MKNLIARFVREDEGQDLVEYALLLAFIALICILAVTNLGQTVNGKYQSVNASLGGS
jgi:pilus assembly protein Flp/PilA